MKLVHWIAIVLLPSQHAGIEKGSSYHESISFSTLIFTGKENCMFVKDFENVISCTKSLQNKLLLHQNQFDISNIISFHD